MLRKLTAVGAAVGTLLVASQAHAQAAERFGDQGQFIFGADRLFNLFEYTSNTVTNNNVNPSESITVTGTSMSFFWGSNSVGVGNGTLALGAGNPNFYSVPRLGFDYTIIPQLTVGGEIIAFFTLGGSTTQSQGGNSQSSSNPSGNTFGIAPRVGYILPLGSDVLSLWLRGGVSFYTGNVSTTATRCNTQVSDTENVNVFGLDLDPQLVISPIPHFGFAAGPTLDWGFAGGASATQPDEPNCTSSTTQSAGYSAFNLGITGGLIGWF